MNKRKGSTDAMKACWVISVITMSVFSGCRHSPEVPLTPVLTFDLDISPIVLNNCATSGCHDGHGHKAALITYADVMRYVSVGKPYQSKLFNTITSLTGNNMPPQGPMSDDQIKTIYIWILQDAKEQ